MQAVHPLVCGERMKASEFVAQIQALIAEHGD